jgi:hypothetical protein
MKIKYHIKHKTQGWTIYAFFTNGHYVGYTASGTSNAAMSSCTKFWWDNCVPRSEEFFAAKMQNCPRVSIVKEILK